MGPSDRIDAVIAELTRDVKPVRVAPPPAALAALWLGGMVLLAGALALWADDRAMMARLMAASDLWLAALGSALTAVLAAFATMELAMPDARPHWALLPLPGLALWVGASGAGCLRGWAVGGVTDATLSESRTCFGFILLVSAPLSALMLLLVRRAYPLRPHLVMVVAGLGVAAAANVLLNFFHPYDASLTDLVTHFVAVALVILGHRLLSPVLPGPAPAVVRRREGRNGAA